MKAVWLLEADGRKLLALASRRPHKWWVHWEVGLQRWGRKQRLLESLCTQKLYGMAFLLERLRKINGEGCLRKEIASGLEYLTDFQITIFTISWVWNQVFSQWTAPSLLSTVGHYVGPDVAAVAWAGGHYLRRLTGQQPLWHNRHCKLIQERLTLDWSETRGHLWWDQESITAKLAEQDQWLGRKSCRPGWTALGILALLTQGSSANDVLYKRKATKWMVTAPNLEEKCTECKKVRESPDIFFFLNV